MAYTQFTQIPAAQGQQAGTAVLPNDYAPIELLLEAHKQKADEDARKHAEEQANIAQRLSTMKFDDGDMFPQDRSNYVAPALKAYDDLAAQDPEAVMPTTGNLNRHAKLDEVHRAGAGVIQDAIGKKKYYDAQADYLSKNPTYDTPENRKMLEDFKNTDPSKIQPIQFQQPNVQYNPYDIAEITKGAVTPDETKSTVTTKPLPNGLLEVTTTTPKDASKLNDAIESAWMTNAKGQADKAKKVYEGSDALKAAYKSPHEFFVATQKAIADTSPDIKKETRENAVGMAYLRRDLEKTQTEAAPLVDYTVSLFDPNSKAYQDAKGNIQTTEAGYHFAQSPSGMFVRSAGDFFTDPDNPKATGNTTSIGAFVNKDGQLFAIPTSQITQTTSGKPQWNPKAGTIADVNSLIKDRKDQIDILGSATATPEEKQAAKDEANKITDKINASGALIPIDNPHSQILTPTADERYKGQPNVNYQEDFQKYAPTGDPNDLLKIPRKVGGQAGEATKSSTTIIKSKGGQTSDNGAIYEYKGKRYTGEQINDAAEKSGRTVKEYMEELGIK